ncbi:NAD(P)/FAD-dependent oxidoreductase [Niabella yanshanensis]|uniref:NAD(P)/FAD-dependent oxidoreductase n=1 Tax=Niabella yanshanensis TaxID=577386 RepID=A0ABZ0W315_9BACT|nr:NAD(P)/FAD-dependent oxidoreductase [Niabella yanshanensis]WQD37655.1 NAD(P)/FAD-dependent oxidoreductase [Niabella yanshanensis]
MNVYDYDIGIVGGGLAGLTAAIQLRKKGYTVSLWEKNKYPFHRVCGEYISKESWDYLQRCGIDLPALQLPEINKLELSSHGGSVLKAKLDLGGFGISRYWLDYLLYEEAKRQGVAVFEGAKVEQLFYRNGSFEILAGSNSVKVKLALGSFGKRSNIDVKWQRKFVAQKPDSLNNYIGVKYHIKTDLPNDTIALHNFKGGYCGVSKVEADLYCLCYLTTASNLQAAGGIREMEERVLFRNSYLRKIFEQSKFIFTAPVTISQVSFNRKELIYDQVPLAGDACGMITPLCGNGMSMAMHSGKIFTNLADDFLQQRISLEGMLGRYAKAWDLQFSGRLQIGRMVQANFGKEWQTHLFISALKYLPGLTNRIIKATHGQPF